MQRGSSNHLIASDNGTRRTKEVSKAKCAPCSLPSTYLKKHVVGEYDLTTRLKHLRGKGAAGVERMLVLGARLDLGVNGIPLFVLVVNAAGKILN